MIFILLISYIIGHVFTGLALHEVFIITVALHLYRYRKVKIDNNDKSVKDASHYMKPLKNYFTLSKLV